MINPSIVNDDRSLLERKARIAMAKMSRTTTDRPFPPGSDTAHAPPTREPSAIRW
jgi:hypothetical protein